MRSVLLVTLALNFTAGLAYAQAPATPPAPANAPTPADAQKPGARTAAVPSVEEGAQLFGTSCGFCHQAGGRAPGRGPKLAGSEKTDDVLRNRIRVGKEGAMPAYGRAFSDAQIRSLIAYIRSLKDDE